MPIEVIDQGLARMNPLKRVGVPADIAKAVSLLVSPESEWINGTLLIPIRGFSSRIADKLPFTGQVIRLSGGGV
jgi:NAD(P)-dependent dehydrogenase (short-subunit alcohol dehydrogenase family)